MNNKIYIRHNSEAEQSKLTSAYDRYESNYGGTIETRRDGDSFVTALDRDKVGDFNRLYQDVKLTGGDVDLKY